MKCKYGHDVEKIQTILSHVGEVEGPYEEIGDEDNYVICLGYVERALPCGHYLGEGYGDVLYFKDRKKGNKKLNELRLKDGMVIEEG